MIMDIFNEDLVSQLLITAQTAQDSDFESVSCEGDEENYTMEFSRPSSNSFTITVTTKEIDAKKKFKEFLDKIPSEVFLRACEIIEEASGKSVNEWNKEYEKSSAAEGKEFEQLFTLALKAAATEYINNLKTSLF